MREVPMFIGLLKFQEILLISAVFQGVPFTRDYGEALDNRSLECFSLSYILSKGQTGQQLLLEVFCMNRQMAQGKN